ncbi:hypothetical protein EHRUM4_02500, partial [Ehrlichia ruminantium]
LIRTGKFIKYNLVRNYLNFGDIVILTIFNGQDSNLCLY